MRYLYRKPFGSVLVLCVCFLGAGAAHAQTSSDGQSGTFQQPPAPTEQQMAVMRRDVQTAAAYPLPTDFFPRMINTLEILRSTGLQPPAPTGRTSLNETIARVAAVPGIDAVLKSQGFTPRDFVMGLTCFGITYAVTTNTSGNTQDAPKLNPANIRLLQGNQAGVQGLLQEMGNTPSQGQ
ncbi:hypothetical protein [Acetobacter conturbans]|uniref:Uncharacterized protein n=1 Tax=Acetobacter conturbans TaxID=1737472 RepID=A0ABX0K1X2_9PROT|nr:hypothetical protein [Acetobacter conturbans]NHN87714.1 hypothetical protein [Acetobacter conturbans]